MDDDHNRNFTNREFIQLVRDRLAAAGRRDVMVKRGWIDEGTAGCPFLLNVPVGPELIVPIRPWDDFRDVRSAEDLHRHADAFAAAIINLRRVSGVLEEYVGDVRRAARTRINSAREAGLDLSLVGVSLKPTYAHQLAPDFWEDGECDVNAYVRVRNTSFYLQPEVTDVFVDDLDDMANELTSLMEEQRERQDRIVELEAIGADLEIDPVTLDLLVFHGLDPEAILRQVMKQQCVNLTMQHGGRDVSLSFSTSAGRVRSTVILDEAVWNGEHLWFTHPDAASSCGSLVGKSLGDRVSHPVLASRPIAAVDSGVCENISFDLSGRFLFDADTGRLWRQEGLAA